jgi:molybdenum cofactor cytidylyltransferase
VKGIAGILLAAGASRRFGGPKLLQPLPSGEPLALTAARNLITAVPNTLAVVRVGDRALADAFARIGVRVLENPRPDDGLASSLATGLRDTPDAAGWLIALADMPWVRSETIASLADELRAGASIIAPVHKGRRGHPVGFAAGWYSALLALSGNQGARDLLAEQAAVLTLLPTPDPGILLDVDREADIQRAQRL